MPMTDAMSGAGAAPSWNWQWFLLSFDGRITRTSYWLRFNLPFFVISLVIDVVNGAVTSSVAVPAIFALLSLWPSVAVNVKRCHDRGRSGLFLLVGLIPIIGAIWLLIELGFLRGTVGSNRHGPDPLQGGAR
jgi:uncharacterized membrane protein YhaH (DUF805 family)